MEPERRVNSNRYRLPNRLRKRSPLGRRTRPPSRARERPALTIVVPGLRPASLPGPSTEMRHCHWPPACEVEGNIEDRSTKCRNVGTSMSEIARTQRILMSFGETRMFSWPPTEPPPRRCASPPALDPIHVKRARLQENSTKKHNKDISCSITNRGSRI